MTEFEIAERQAIFAEKAKDEARSVAEGQLSDASKARLEVPSAPIPVKQDATGQDVRGEKPHRALPVAKTPRKGRREAKSLARESAKVPLPRDDNFTGEAPMIAGESSNTPMPPGENLQRLIDLARTRNVWLQARNRIFLHALSLCRSMCAGDKDEARKLYNATVKGDDIRIMGLIGPFIEDIERWDTRIAPLEKAMAALVAETPIGAFIKDTKGLGPLSMATLIGHTGALSNYATIAKLWRRLGLDVSENGESRAPLIIPGIADQRPRRAAAYVVGSGLMRASNPDFRMVYDREKEKAIGKGWVKARAHNHAMRVATKHFIRLAWRAWQ